MTVSVNPASTRRGNGNRLLIDTPNPTAVDETLGQLPGGAVLLQDDSPDGYLKRDGHYVMRVFGDAGFVRFACEQQGYCTIVEQLERLV